MSQAATKTRLLDAAESLFSQQGFANTSMRAITTRAKANLAAANYHFGSKEALLSAVLKRRLRPFNQLRSDKIDQVLVVAAAAGELPAAEALLRAFIEPTFNFRQNEKGSREYIRMIGRAMTAADPVVRDCFLALVHTLFNKLHQALCLALPQLPAELIFTRLFFTMGAMGHCLCFAGIDQIFKPGAEEILANNDLMADKLIQFVTAGVEAPC